MHRSNQPPTVDVDAHEKDENDDQERAAIELQGDPEVVVGNDRLRRLIFAVVVEQWRQNDSDDEDDEGAGKKSHLLFPFEIIYDSKASTSKLMTLFKWAAKADY